MNRPEASGPPEPVVVVGAGPVGCTVALLLADRGIRVTVLERHGEPHPLPRAVHLDDEVARILHGLGVGQRFLACSRPASGLRLLDARHRVMGEFTRDRQIGRHGFPQANMFHQPDLEELLLARVARHPLIDLRRSVQVVDLDGYADPLAGGALGPAPVRVVARTVADGQEETIAGRLVLGCDGANSTVRGLVGIDLEDLGFTERWLVVDIRAGRPLDVWDGVEQICDPARAATFMHVTADRYRWEFQLLDGEDEADLVAPEVLGRLLRPWTGRDDLDGLEVVRSATYTFRARVASRFQAGRAFLLGDAAHLTPPFIGQGLGAGLRDADNLAWKVAYVLTGRAAPALLDSYDQERRPHATAMVKKAVTVGWAMTGGQDRAAVVRRLALAAACRSARFRDLMASPSTPRLKRGALQPGRRPARVPRPLRAGELIGNPVVRTADRGTARLDDLLQGHAAVLTAGAHRPDLARLCARHQLVLVRLSADGRPAAVPAAGSATPAEGSAVGSPDRSRDRSAAGSPEPVATGAGPGVEVGVIDPGEHGLAALLADPALAVLVRPDRVIAAVARAPRRLRLPWPARIDSSVPSVAAGA